MSSSAILKPTKARRAHPRERQPEQVGRRQVAPPARRGALLVATAVALLSLLETRGAIAVPLSAVGGGGGGGLLPAMATAGYRPDSGIVVQQAPIRIIRCPQCDTTSLIIPDSDVAKYKRSGFSDQRIAELEGMLMNNRVRKSGFSDQRLAEMEALLLNGNKVRRSGFSDQRIAEMEAMLMNSMKRPAQRAIVNGEQSG